MNKRLNMHNIKSMHTRQNGAVLAVALMILVVLTIIGVASVNSSILEMVMAGNTQNRVKALNNAESTILMAQKEVTGKGDLPIANGVLSCSDGTTGVYHSANGSCPGVTSPELLDVTSLDWDGTDSLTGLDANNRFIVESLGVVPASSCTVDTEDTDCTSKFAVYRITARSEDVRGTVRMVQAIWNNSAN